MVMVTSHIKIDVNSERFGIFRVRKQFVLDGKLVCVSAFFELPFKQRFYCVTFQLFRVSSVRSC